MDLTDGLIISAPRAIAELGRSTNIDRMLGHELGQERQPNIFKSC